MYVKDPYKTKYQFLINKRKITGLKHVKDPKGFIEYSIKCRYAGCLQKHWWIQFKQKT